MIPIRSFLAAASLLSLLPSVQAAVLTDFGGFTFEVEASITSVGVIQDASSLLATGVTNGDILAGYFSTFDISGLGDIRLTASIAGANPNFLFQVYLLGEDLASYMLFEGESTFFGPTASTIGLTYIETVGGPFTNVAAFQFVASGTGDPFEMTFSKLEAVPEPSVMILSSIALGGVALLARRRKRG